MDECESAFADDGKPGDTDRGLTCDKLWHSVQLLPIKTCKPSTLCLLGIYIYCIYIYTHTERERERDEKSYFDLITLIERCDNFTYKGTQGNLEKCSKLRCWIHFTYINKAWLLLAISLVRRMSTTWEIFL